MLRMMARRTSQRDVTAGTDAVIFGISLPGGSRINAIRAQVNMESPTVTTVNRALLYMCEGWILPVLDPDSAANFDTIWDTLVPKDTDVAVLDLDTGGADTTSMFEPGEIDISAIVDVGLRPERIFQRRRMISFANRPLGVHFDTDMKWRASDTFNINIRKNYSVSQPSVVLFAIGSPILDDTTTSIELQLKESEWSRIKFLRDVLHDATMHWLGLTETGAETPFVDAATLIQQHLEPDVVEQTTGMFGNAAWWVVADAIIDHSVVGEIGSQTVTTGR